MPEFMVNSGDFISVLTVDLHDKQRLMQLVF